VFLQRVLYVFFLSLVKVTFYPATDESIHSGVSGAVNINFALTLRQSVGRSIVFALAACWIFHENISISAALYGYDGDTDAGPSWQRF
jgi:hypothetical protein